ncbi:hypothetical protein ABC970_12815 [Bacillus licheniformis]|uniref:hypothetical protein n=1 Tax=Bacillus TaxID=1386 RepID=UPI00163C8CB4|nr:MULTISPECIES: hypothetical protein [Bacillus]MBJ7887987.1 hypothetical protein [Bacillaceae bacterium HSR45]MCY9266436.1 hypothetical protein [Bacillus licheniformis]MEC0794197.1 hypothetical protein [Bacillus licheniformis]QNH44423.1 hypothetical protein H7F26_02535 [Bacillus sp. PAMC28748]
MSLVSIVARENFITVMTDGRVTSDGKIVQEDYKKFIHLNKDMFFAFAGEKEPCEFIAQWAKEYCKNYGLEKMALSINDFVLNNKLDRFKVLTSFGGVDSNRIKLYTYCTIEKTTEQYIPEGDKLENTLYAFLYNSSAEDNDFKLKEILGHNLNKYGFNTPNKCLKAQKDLNDIVASKSFGVNKVTFDLTIKK